MWNWAEWQIVLKSRRVALRHIFLLQEQNYYAELLRANTGNVKKTLSKLRSVVNEGIKKQIQAKFKMKDGSVSDDKPLTSEKLIISSQL